MDWLAVGKAISDLGGWAAFLALVAIIGVTGMRGGWVFGWIYRREVERADKATTQAERNDESLSDQGAAFKVMAQAYDRLERSFDRLASRVRD